MTASFVVAIAALGMLVSGASSDVPLSPSRLPIVLIKTAGSEITQGEKTRASLEIVSYPEQSGAASVVLASNIGIKIRGKTSAGFAKKQYSIEFRDHEGQDAKLSVLGMPAHEDWILHGPYSDKSLLRNRLMYTLARETGRYAPRTRFVEVVVQQGPYRQEQDYQGLYLFMEKVRRGEHRVPVAKWKQGESDGGIILERTTRKKLDPGETHFLTQRSGRPFSLVYPDKRAARMALETAKNFVDEFEAALLAEPNTATEAYARYLDVPSAVDFVLLNEFANNVDFFFASTFMYKNPGGKLQLGPIWDFNIALGNVDRDDGSSTEGWRSESVAWAEPLFRKPSFRRELKQRWLELRETFAVEHLNSLIERDVELIRGAASRNFERWPILGKKIGPNPTPIPSNFEGEVAALMAWTTARVRWIDSRIADPEFASKRMNAQRACDNQRWFRSLWGCARD